MIKLFFFWLKYTQVTSLSVPQYNEGIKHAQKLNLDDLFVYLNDDELRDADKLKSLYEQIGKYEILTHIASCVVKPRFRRWKEKNRLKYCKDISRSIDLSFTLSGFFFSYSGLRQKNLGNYLTLLGKN